MHVIRPIPKIISLLLSLVVASVLCYGINGSGVVSASATTPKSVPGPTYLTLAQAESRLYNRYVGPDSATGYGQYHILGFRATNSSGYAHTIASLTYGGNPTVASLTRSMTSTTASGIIWYEPWTWDWPHIMGTAWDAVWNGCLKGAVTGVVGTAGTTMMTNLLARGAVLYIGWEGYAAVAFGGCFAVAVMGP